MALFFNKEIQKSKKTRIVFATTYSFDVSAQSLENYKERSIISFQLRVILILLNYFSALNCLFDLETLQLSKIYIIYLFIKARSSSTQAVTASITTGTLRAMARSWRPAIVKSSILPVVVLSEFCCCGVDDAGFTTTLNTNGLPLLMPL